MVSLAHGPDDGSTERRVVQRSSDAFHDVSLLPVAGVARKVADEGVVRTAPAAAMRTRRVTLAAAVLAARAHRLRWRARLQQPASARAAACARTGAFAPSMLAFVPVAVTIARCARQATFLGFAGTTGASKAIDWLVTDPVLTPPEFAPRGFSERLLLLPHTYQPQVVTLCCVVAVACTGLTRRGRAG